MRHKKKIRNSGFTIVETLVVVAVIGIMAGIAIPSFIGWLPDYRLRSATRDIVSCFQEMKYRAVAENSNTVVVFDLIGEKYQSFVDDGGNDSSNLGSPNDYSQNGSEIILKEVFLPTGVEFDSSTFHSSSAPYYFGFNSRGMPSTGTGRITLDNSNSKSMDVIINSVGNIRVE